MNDGQPPAGWRSWLSEGERGWLQRCKLYTDKGGDPGVPAGYAEKFARDLAASRRELEEVRGELRGVKYERGTQKARAESAERLLGEIAPAFAWYHWNAKRQLDGKPMPPCEPMDRARWSRDEEMLGRVNECLSRAHLASPATEETP